MCNAPRSCCREPVFKGMKYEKKIKSLWERRLWTVEEGAGGAAWKLALDCAEMERRQTEPCALAAGGGRCLRAQEHACSSKLGARIEENWKLAVPIMNFGVRQCRERSLAGSACLMHGAYWSPGTLGPWLVRTARWWNSRCQTWRAPACTSAEIRRLAEEFGSVCYIVPKQQWAVFSVHEGFSILLLVGGFSCFVQTPGDLVSLDSGIHSPLLC